MRNLIPSPGGAKLTASAIELCMFPDKAKIADIGCGEGETVALLCDKYGFDAVGIDIDADLIDNLSNPRIILGSAEDMPFTDKSMDGLFFECSMSKTADMTAVLKECSRVLNPSGTLVISDLYARGQPHVFEGALYRIDTWDTLKSKFEKAGYSILHFEDRSEDLVQLWGELIFQHGTDPLCDNFGTDLDTLKSVKCGYFLAVLRLAEEV